MNWLIGSTMLASSAVIGPLPPPAEDVLTPPPALVEQAREAVRLPGRDERRNLRDLTEFMLSSHGLNMGYIAAPTTTVAETWEAGQGNCLSFTLMFIALAREMGLNAFPREVDMPLGWERDRQLLFELAHINAGVRSFGQEFIVDFEPDPILASRLSASHRGRQVDMDRALAHFYNNRAAELLAEGNAEAARMWSAEALSRSPDFTPALNNRGVIERHLGNHLQARYFLERAIELDDRRASTLFNLIALHRTLGNDEAVDRYQARVERLRPEDPFFQAEIARKHEQAGNYRQARRFYRRAIDRLPDEHSFHGDLARVAFRLGDRDGAAEALLAAAERSEENHREHYLHRLKAIKTAQD